MARKQNPSPPPPKVLCADCRRFRRDTEGISFSIQTGEYFMGTCALGLTPDTPRKQFADKPRLCRKFTKATNTPTASNFLSPSL